MTSLRTLVLPFVAVPQFLERIKKIYIQFKLINKIMLFIFEEPQKVLSLQTPDFLDTKQLTKLMFCACRGKN